MTDQQYYDAYEGLTERLFSDGELDADLFSAIFEGKIKPIVRNAFSKHDADISSIDLDDAYQDVFMKLWSRCVSMYFMNDKYETGPAWFLGWCKIVSENYVTSLLRKKSLAPHDTLDDPDHPVSVAEKGDVSERMIGLEAVDSVFRAVMEMNTKAEVKLTWFGVYLSVYSGEATDRIRATHLFVERYLGTTLSDLLKGVKDSMISSPVGIGPGEFAKIENEIVTGGKNGSRASEKMRDLLGDEPLAKISDWIYKTNKKLSSALPPEVTEWNT